MAGLQSKNGVKTWDFEFIGTSVSDPAGRTYASSEVFPNFVSNLAEIADYVFRFCIVSEVVARRVAIVCHGSTAGIRVGTDHITEATLEQFSTAFKKLGLVMVPGIAVLELYACQVGQNRALLRAISNLMDGTAVIAYEQNQPASGGGNGKIAKCKLDKCTAIQPRHRKKHKGSAAPLK